MGGDHVLDMRGREKHSRRSKKEEENPSPWYRRRPRRSAQGKEGKKKHNQRFIYPADLSPSLPTTTTTSPIINPRNSAFPHRFPAKRVYDGLSSSSGSSSSSSK